MVKYIHIVLFCFSTISIAQIEEKLSKEKYIFLMDSLNSKKALLLNEKKLLIQEIDSLENKIEKLKEESISVLRKKLVRKYGSKNGMRLANGQIWKGMSENMLEDSWGKPDKITKNKEKWGLFKQWYYGDITYFFRDGILTGWEEIK